LDAALDTVQLLTGLALGTHNVIKYLGLDVAEAVSVCHKVNAMVAARNLPAMSQVVVEQNTTTINV
jgi:hypothetical protein